MYREHFGLQQAPFRITPQTEYFYAGAQRGPLLDALLFALESDEGIIRISGEVGTGKTMLCRMLIERLPPETLIIYIANPSLSPAELIATVGHELEIDTADGHGLLRQIEHRLIGLYGEGRRVIAIIDEAHAMPRESLDQIRLLSNLETGTRKLMQIVLFGQPELDEILEERAMRSLRERITQSFFLKPLDHHQIRDYVDFRLRAAGYRGPDLFNTQALERIARASKGLTRRVNILADKTLLAAFAENTHTITDKHVSAAIRDANYRNAELPVRKILMSLGGLALFSVSALVAWQMIPAETREAAPSSAPSSATPDASSEGQNSNPPVEPHTATIFEQTAATRTPIKALQPATPQTPASSSSPARIISSAPPTASNPERYAPIPEQLGPIARERLLASRADMDKIADTQWFIQLRSIPASNAPTLESFIPSANKAIDPAQLRLFVVKNDPKQTIGVIYGAYANAQEAYVGLAKLPAWIKAGGAFARPYKALRADSKKASANAVASGPANGK
ncbi:hypothetical protein GCM10027046_12980 [Uliginosibacterium flavum]|uniref:AAA family ATPase n=1 Tax=Uliginosibacterium flavum TaxID=1396831 RepID=A0ABV2TMG2_9RHOO